MNHSSFDALTRRTSLMSLGAAGVTALARPFAADAKKKRKNHKKGDINKLCKTQVEPCISFQIDACGDNPSCKVNLHRCCQFFATCDPTGFWTCLIDAFH
jgi:hypothetical protein